MNNTNNLNELAIVKKDYKLADGRILPIGVNFRSLQLMTAYDGGFDRMSDDMKGDNINTKLNACGYLLYSLIRASGEEITVEEATMMIGIEDFDKLFDIFEDYANAVEKMQKKTSSKQKKLRKLNGQS